MEKIQEAKSNLPRSDFNYILNLGAPEVKSMKLQVTTRALNNSEIIGQYGDNVHGNLEIFVNKNGNLSITFGTEGLGTLEFIEGNFYKINWTSDILHQFWSDGGGYREFLFRVEFLVDQSIMNMFMYDSHIAVFRKNNSLSSAPVIPYPPNSCSRSSE